MKTLKITIELEVKSDPSDETLLLEDILAKVQENIEEGQLEYSIDTDDLDEEDELY